MNRLDHTAFIIACRDERGVGQHTLRAYAQDPRTFARFTKARQLADLNRPGLPEMLWFNS